MTRHSGTWPKKSAQVAEAAKFYKASITNNPGGVEGGGSGACTETAVHVKNNSGQARSDIKGALISRQLRVKAEDGLVHVRKSGNMEARRGKQADKATRPQ